MEQHLNLEEANGIRFTWNTFPSSRLDATRITVPLGFHYQPIKPIENLPLLEYEPVLCKQCKSVLSPSSMVNFKAKNWECPFCNTRNSFPTLYSQNISETMLPTELQPEFTTVEYKLNKKESSYPTFLFLIDTCVDEEELNELKESIQQAITTLPSECSIGVITFGNVCQVHEIGFAEFPVSYNFKGDIHYKGIEIQEMLGLISVNRTMGSTSTITNNGNIHRFIVPLKDCEFTLNTFLDDLQPDPWGKNPGERYSRSSGLALQIGISLLETMSHGEPSRILLFMGGATTVGLGQIVGKSLTETIRNYVDFEKGSSNTQYYKSACEFYETMATRAAKAGQIIDIFCCSLNQVGLYEMKCLVEKTGGYAVMTDSFSTMIFKDTLRRMFETDEETGDLKMCFKGRIEVNTVKPIYLSGAIGHLVSLEQKAGNVSELVNFNSGTRSWYTGGMDQNSTYSFILDINSDSSNKLVRQGVIQVLTHYIAGDRSHRLRVTTVNRKFTGDLSNMACLKEIGDSFDQDAACVMMVRHSVMKSKTEDYGEILKWIDKSLIRLISKFASFTKEDIRSFKLPQTFQQYPQYMFYLRRSHFVSNFNASPDEITFYKTILLRENVNNSTVMVQPVLFSYTAENPEASPAFLDIDSMKNDNILFLDAYFFITIWHGEDVCKWRDTGLQYEEDYENVKIMLESPQDYAQQLLAERLPVPRFVSCDAGSGQERLIKSTVNPSSSEISSKIVQDGFMSDDVTLKKFMEYLIKLVVSS